MKITAKYDGRCGECGRRIDAGDEIEYIDKKAYHPDCIEAEISLADDRKRNPKSDTPSAKDDGYRKPEKTPEQIADSLGFTKDEEKSA